MAVQPFGSPAGILTRKKNDKPSFIVVPRLDVSKVTDMESMFGNATSFNQPLNKWNVSNVTNMSSLFWVAT